MSNNPADNVSNIYRENLIVNFKKRISKCGLKTWSNIILNSDKPVLCLNFQPWFGKNKSHFRSMHVLHFKSPKN